MPKTPTKRPPRRTGAGARPRGRGKAPAPTKGKGLQAKVGGIPVWVLVVGGAVLAWIIYNRAGSAAAPADTSTGNGSGGFYPIDSGASTSTDVPADTTAPELPPGGGGGGESPGGGGGGGKKPKYIKVKGKWVQAVKNKQGKWVPKPGNKFGIPSTVGGKGKGKGGAGRPAPIKNHSAPKGGGGGPKSSPKVGHPVARPAPMKGPAPKSRPAPAGRHK